MQPVATLFKQVVWQIGSAPEISAGQLMQLCAAILALEELGVLRSLPDEDHLRCGQTIRGCQNPAGGWFGEAQPGGPAAAGSGWDMSLQTLRTTHFALQALAALGMKAVHHLQFMDSQESATALAGWLAGQDWTKMLPTSERVLYVLGLLIYRAEEDGDDFAPELFHRVLDVLEQIQDPKTGLWGIQEGASLGQALTAAYHFLPYFEYVHRPVMRRARIADCALQVLQSAIANNALTAKSFYTSLAAIGILAAFSREFTYQRQEIRRSLARSAATLRDRQQADGSLAGFDAGAELPGDAEEASISASLGRDTILAAWLHCSALGNAASGAVEAGAQAEGGTVHRWPTYGYRRLDRKISPSQAEVLPRWLRPFRDPAGLPPQISSGQPAISTVIPCYNLGIYLREAVQSVLDQAYRSFEIIIVDDGSTDDYTRWVLTHIDLPQARIIRQPNRGLSAARNAGILQAYGEYICCLDPDDRLRPGFFAAAAPILDEHVEVGLVTGWLRVFDEKDGDYRYPDFDFADLLATNQVITPALFRKAAWEKVGGFYESFSLPGIEDWDFWISIYEAGYHACLLSEVLYDYRIRPDAMSASMYVPERWGRMLGELIGRHRTSYAAYMPEVLEKLNSRWADARTWANSLDRGLAWWERQSGMWQHTAERHSRKIMELEAWIVELEDKVQHFDHQLAMMDELRATIRRLEQDKSWTGKSVEMQQRWIDSPDWLEGRERSWLSTAWRAVGKSLDYLRGAWTARGGSDDRS